MVGPGGVLNGCDGVVLWFLFRFFRTCDVFLGMQWRCDVVVDVVLCVTICYHC